MEICLGNRNFEFRSRYFVATLLFLLLQFTPSYSFHICSQNETTCAMAQKNQQNLIAEVEKLTDIQEFDRGIISDSRQVGNVNGVVIDGIFLHQKFGQDGRNLIGPTQEFNPISNWALAYATVGIAPSLGLASSGYGGIIISILETAAARGAVHALVDLAQVRSQRASKMTNPIGFRVEMVRAYAELIAFTELVGKSDPKLTSQSKKLTAQEAVETDTIVQRIVSDVRKSNADLNCKSDDCLRLGYLVKFLCRFTFRHQGKLELAEIHACDRYSDTTDKLNDLFMANTNESYESGVRMIDEHLKN